MPHRSTDYLHLHVGSKTNSVISMSFQARPQTVKCLHMGTTIRRTDWHASPNPSPAAPKPQGLLRNPQAHAPQQASCLPFQGLLRFADALLDTKRRDAGLRVWSPGAMTASSHTEAYDNRECSIRSRRFCKNCISYVCDD